MDEVIENKKATIEIFRDHIEKDIKFGLKSEVYRKCEALFKDSTIHFISVVEKDSIKPMCELEKPVDEGLDVVEYIEYVYFDENRSNILGEIKISFNTKVNKHLLQKNLITSVLIFFLTILVILVPFKNALVAFLAPLRKFVAVLEGGEIDNIQSYANNSFSDISEINGLYRAVQTMSSQIQEYKNKQMEKMKNDVLYEQSKQIAHDIQSPLAALEVAMEDFKNLPESTRKMTLNAVTRIKGIANELTNSDDLIGKNGDKPTILSILISSLIVEKKLEYNHFKKLNIAFLDHTKQSDFVCVSDNLFMRIISNLINNSIEALDGVGEVRISLFKKDEVNNKIFLKIEDNGPGFPSEILSGGILRGKTLNKAGGQGLGLSFAQEEVEKCGGEFLIGNTPFGSKVEMSFNVTETPGWFCSILDLSKVDNVIILDDDESIHGLWDIKLKETKISIQHYFSYNDLLKNVKSFESTLLLIDYDLRDLKNGMDIINEIKPEYCFLVTSNYDEEKVLEACLVNDIKLIPKQLVSSLKIKVQ